MIFTDYIKAENLPGNPKTRYDVTASTKNYLPFEIRLQNKKGGRQFFYFGDTPCYFKFASKERPDKCISRNGNISSVFIPDLAAPLGYGDVYHTQDAIIILFSNEWKTIEIFIARGQRNNKMALYWIICSQELQDEFEMLRRDAKEC
jgi:hypothetical protein